MPWSVFLQSPRWQIWDLYLVQPDKQKCNFITIFVFNNSQCNVKVIDKSIRYNKYCLIIHSLNYFEYNTFFLGIKNIKLEILNEIMRQGIHICITFTHPVSQNLIKSALLMRTCTLRFLCYYSLFDSVHISLVKEKKRNESACNVAYKFCISISFNNK